MSLLTSWGYTLTGEGATLGDIITAAEFNAFTAGRYAGDSRIAPGISAASLAFRNYCGWHVTGSMDCKISWTADNRGITRTGCDLLIQLPARFVSTVSKVTVAGTETTDFHLENNGLLIVYDVAYLSRKDIVEVEYTAGIADAAVIKEFVAQMVTLQVAKSYGVTSEAAGGVSITYNSVWTNGSFDQILSNNAGLLLGYRLEGVF